MRLAILGWSTLGGAIVGLIIGSLAFGILLVVASVLPAPVGRAFERARLVVALLLLAGAPLAGAALGYLEGKLKL